MNRRRAGFAAAVILLGCSSPVTTPATASTACPITPPAAPSGAPYVNLHGAFPYFAAIAAGPDLRAGGIQKVLSVIPPGTTAEVTIRLQAHPPGTGTGYLEATDAVLGGQQLQVKDEQQRIHELAETITLPASGQQWQDHPGNFLVKTPGCYEFVGSSGGREAVVVFEAH